MNEKQKQVFDEVQDCLSRAEYWQQRCFKAENLLIKLLNPFNRIFLNHKIKNHFEVFEGIKYE